MSQCRSCGAAIIWAETQDARMPLDVEPVVIPAVGLVAFNPATGRARVLSAESLGKVEAWRSGGVTVHRSHWATCPSAEQHRVHPAQEALL
jgi:hypothetical protein